MKYKYEARYCKHCAVFVDNKSQACMGSFVCPHFQCMCFISVCRRKVHSVPTPCPHFAVDLVHHPNPNVLSICRSRPRPIDLYGTGCRPPGYNTVKTKTVTTTVLRKPGITVTYSTIPNRQHVIFPFNHKFSTALQKRVWC